jgi:hypothetical protein
MVPYFTFGNIKNVPTLMMYEPASYKERIITPDKKYINISLQVESDFPETGNVSVTVKSSEPASFSLALRVPSWSSSFTATVDGKTYQGITNQNLVIDRFWKPGEKIKISFEIPVQILDGGNSYPGMTAFRRGPQVLALDSSLNGDVLKQYPMITPGKLAVGNLSGKTNPLLLPNKWIGKQAYTVTIRDEKNMDQKRQLILVPFADASQTEADMKVWLPVNVLK